MAEFKQCPNGHYYQGAKHTLIANQAGLHLVLKAALSPTGYVDLQRHIFRFRSTDLAGSGGVARKW